MEEKRRETRFKAEDKILIESDSSSGKSNEKKEYVAFMKDISIGGIKMLTDQSFPIDSVLKITLFLSNLKQPIVMPGRVKWISQDKEKGLFEIGINFLHKDPETTLALMLHLYDKHIKNEANNINDA